MLVFKQLFDMMTCLTWVCLVIEPSLAKSLIEDQSETVAELAPPRPTESREVQDYINQLFTPEGVTPRMVTHVGSVGPASIQEPPDCVKKRGYCTVEDEQLPEDLAQAVNELLDANPIYTEMFNATDVLSDDDKGIGERGPDDREEEPSCLSLVEKKKLSWGENIDGAWMRIAQTDNFSQTVRLEHCTTNGCHPCHRRIVAGLTLPYHAQCVQKHIVRELLALTEGSKKVLELIPHRFKVPSCCACVLVKMKDGRKNEKCDKFSGFERFGSEEKTTVQRVPSSGSSRDQTNTRLLLLWTAVTSVVLFYY